MADTLVDTAVFLDVAKPDPVWRAWSERRVADALNEGRVLMNQVVLAELAAGYDTFEQLNQTFRADVYHRESLPFDAAFAAGIAFLDYRRRGGARTSPLPDFFIGAHAAVRGYRLLTRGRGTYATYFPTLTIISPETHP